MTAIIAPADLATRLGLTAPPTREQAEAISAPLRPHVVVAGAGSGKTQTMGLRVVWLVANGLVEPHRVLGLTFTRKAAAELGERVRRMLRRLQHAHDESPFLADDVAAALRTGEPTVTTYHSYAAALVGEHALRIGLEPDTRLVGEAVSWQYAAQVVESYDDEAGDLVAVDRAVTTVIGDVLALAGELAEHLREPAEVRILTARVQAHLAALPRAEGQRSRGLPKAVSELQDALESRATLLPLVERYAAYKRSRGAMDYGDQVAIAAAHRARPPGGRRDRAGPLLGGAPRRVPGHRRGAAGAADGAVRARPRGDRGRRPAPVHLRLARRERGQPGALRRRLRRRRADRQQRPDHQLPQRRGHPRRRQRGRRRHPGARRARGGGRAAAARARVGEGTGEAVVALLDSVADEAEWVADQVLALGDATTSRLGTAVPWGQVAVLARKRSHFARLEAALRARGVPCEVVGLGGLLTRPEVVDVVSTLRVLADPGAGGALLRLLAGPRWRHRAARPRRARPARATHRGVDRPAAVGLGDRRVRCRRQRWQRRPG